jgi:hypothetical protein
MAVSPTIAPVDLATIKDDLGIDAADTSNDAWLVRRIDGIWSRFEAYTFRHLRLAAPWTDDWGEIARTLVHRQEPPPLVSIPRATVFLRVFPVEAVTGLWLNDQQQADLTQLVFDGATGKVLSLRGVALWNHDAGPQLLRERARIAYTAGFPSLPLDLYEALIGCLDPLWAVRQAQLAGFGAGFGGGTVTRINAIDVGEVDLTYTPTPFVDQANKRAAPDPLIGPWSAMLDPYVDWRASIGGVVYPTTKPGP